MASENVPLGFQQPGTDRMDVDAQSRKRPGSRLDGEEPHRKRFAHIGESDRPSHEFRQIDSYQIRGLVEARLPAVGPAVVDELWEGIRLGGGYHFHADFEQVVDADIGTKLEAVGHHLEGDIVEGVKMIVDEVAKHGPEAQSCGGDPDFHRQVIEAAPSLSKILHENRYHAEGNVAARLGGNDPIKSVVQARLPNVGPAVIDEIYEGVSSHIVMDDGHAANFHRDVYTAEGLGSDARISVARHYLEPSIAHAVKGIVAEVKENGRAASSCGAEPDYYDQVIRAAPQLINVLHENGFGTEAADAAGLIASAREEGWSKNPALSQSPAKIALPRSRRGAAGLEAR